jgi:hypothetical protein
MTRQLLRGTDISIGIQKVADKGASEVMGGECRDLGLLPSLSQDV